LLPGSNPISRTPDASIPRRVVMLNKAIAGFMVPSSPHAKERQCRSIPRPSAALPNSPASR
jgi:hypothetical protein